MYMFYNVGPVRSPVCQFAAFHAFLYVTKAGSKIYKKNMKLYHWDVDVMATVTVTVTDQTAAQVISFYALAAAAVSHPHPHPRIPVSHGSQLQLHRSRKLGPKP